LGKKRLLVGWTAAPGGAGRWSSCSGDAAARQSTRARRRATARAGEGGGTIFGARGRWNLGSPRRPVMAPADGSCRGGRAFGRRSRRGGGGSHARRGASGSYRWLPPPPPLVAQTSTGLGTASQARHAAGWTSQETSGHAASGHAVASGRSARTRKSRVAAGPRRSTSGWRARRRAQNVTSRILRLTACHRTPVRTLTKTLWCFSQRILRKLLPNFECRSISVYRRCCRLATFFTNFHSKF
jgi:hypothetical protein